MADGFFHVVTWLLVMAGSIMTLVSWRQGRALRPRWPLKWIATLPEGISSTVFSSKFAMINPPKRVTKPAKFRSRKDRKTGAKLQCLFGKDLAQKTPLLGHVLLAIINLLCG